MERKKYRITVKQTTINTYDIDPGDLDLGRDGLKRLIESGQLRLDPRAAMNTRASSTDTPEVETIIDLAENQPRNLFDTWRDH